MNNKNKLLLCAICITLIAAVSACHYPRVHVKIAIISHENEQSVVLNQETRIRSLATASRGVESVALYINNELVNTDTPPEGNPIEYTADQPWTPKSEGHVIISVVTTDVEGRASDPVTITLQVVPAISETNGTPTPTVTVTPLGLDQTQTAEAICTNAATFVEHVTIPINANLTPESNFTKIWRVNNSGSCDWVGYNLIHISGDLLGANSPRALPMVSAGKDADIALEMVAPGTPGTHTSTWRLRAEDGTIFGPELVVTIIVPQPPTDTPTPTATYTPTPTPTATIPPISVEQVRQEISIPANSIGSTTTTCPAGSVIVSGGFSGSDGLRVWQSMRDGNGWRVSARNEIGSPISLNVYAICIRNTDGAGQQEQVQVNVDPNDTTVLTVNCSSGSIITGGGWDIGATLPIEVIQSSQAGNGWQIEVNNTGGDTPQITAFAICLAGAAGSTTQVSEPNGQILPNNTQQLIIACPTNTHVTGGGFTADIDVVIYNTSMMGNGWQNFAQNYTGSQKAWQTHAICYMP
jgi:hypothetical protein